MSHLVCSAKSLNRIGLTKFSQILLLFAFLSCHPAMSDNGIKSNSIEDGAPSEHYYEVIGDKEIKAARVVGKDCQNLTGNIYSSVRVANGFWENFSKFIHKNKATLSSDGSHRQSWKGESIPSTYKFFCVPKVENPTLYLSNDIQSISERAIKIKDGPTLVLYAVDESPAPPRGTGLPETAQWIAGRYREALRIFDCSDNPNEFCFEMNNFTSEVKESEYSYSLDVYKGNHDASGSWDNSGIFRVYCWECSRLRGSKEQFLNGILSSGSFFGVGSTEYILNGGIMFPARYLEDNSEMSVDSKREIRSKISKIQELVNLK